MQFDLVLDGSNLGIHRLVKYSSRQDVQLGISQEGSARIEQARKIVKAAIESGAQVYGLTTGLGARVTEVLTDDEMNRFSMQTLRGRAQSLGDPLPVAVVRGAMIARLNTLMQESKFVEYATIAVKPISVPLGAGIDTEPTSPAFRPGGTR